MCPRSPRPLPPAEVNSVSPRQTHPRDRLDSDRTAIASTAQVADSGARVNHRSEATPHRPGPIANGAAFDENRIDSGVLRSMSQKNLPKTIRFLRLNY
jgi:hypothetical protein